MFHPLFIGLEKFRSPLLAVKLPDYLRVAIFINIHLLWSITPRIRLWTRVFGNGWLEFGLCLVRLGAGWFLCFGDRNVIRTVWEKWVSVQGKFSQIWKQIIDALWSDGCVSSRHLYERLTRQYVTDPTLSISWHVRTHTHIHTHTYTHARYVLNSSKDKAVLYRANMNCLICIAEKCAVKLNILNALVFIAFLSTVYLYRCVVMAYGEVDSSSSSTDFNISTSRDKDSDYIVVFTAVMTLSSSPALSPQSPPSPPCILYVHLPELYLSTEVSGVVTFFQLWIQTFDEKCRISHTKHLLWMKSGGCITQNSNSWWKVQNVSRKTLLWAEKWRMYWTKHYFLMKNAECLAQNTCFSWKVEDALEKTQTFDEKCRMSRTKHRF